MSYPDVICIGLDIRATPDSITLPAVVAISICHLVWASNLLFESIGGSKCAALPFIFLPPTTGAERDGLKESLRK